ncbi:MAG: hypothetical protein L0Z50_42255 [Verrucomicrobiales bacterium]|nr:hypothetical protein [Verrucomicrobiales bacterium]
MTVMLAGVPAPQLLPRLTANSQFLGNVLADPLDVSSAFPANAWLKRFDTAANRWRNRFPIANALAPVNDASAFVLPGEVVWTTTGTAEVVGANLAELQVRYYHQDHLGSSSVIANRSGQLVEEIAHHAFGPVRRRFTSQTAVPKENYAFTAKELDAESGFQDFGARFYAPSLGRFMSVDPVRKFERRAIQAIMQLDLETSVTQSRNSYAYALNNAINLIDPDGKEQKKPGKTATQTHNEEQLKKLTPEMSTKVESVLKALEAKGYSPKIVDSIRTAEEQKKMVEKNVSETLESKHLDQKGHGSGAVDIINNLKSWDYNDKKAEEFFKELGSAAKDESLRWGGDFSKKSEDAPYGWDPGHIELKKEDLPTEQKVETPAPTESPAPSQ